MHIHSLPRAWKCFRAFAVLSILVLPLKKKATNLERERQSILKNMAFRVYVSGKIIVKIKNMLKQLNYFK